MAWVQGYLFVAHDSLIDAFFSKTVCRILYGCMICYINWGALDHASRAIIVIYNYYYFVGALTMLYLASWVLALQVLIII